ncbi:MAG: IclR family transcriptional regulator [Planctomycetes bacterium]|nr:IclR family transcriptional regulator [Planctomycetota bacterium]
MDRGLLLLEFVARTQQPVSLADLTRALEIDRSNVYRLANTLVLRGFLTQLPGSKEYVVGPAIGRLSSRFQWPKQVAREQVLALAATTGETTHLAIQEGDQAFLLDHELCGQPVGVSASSGHCEPLHVTAVGKALIVDFDEAQLLVLFGGETLPRWTKRTVLSVTELAKECRRCKQRGFAIDDEEFHDRVCCIASPIRDASGAVVASIGVSAPADRLPKHRWKSVGSVVMGAAAEVSGKLGYCESSGRALKSRPRIHQS